MIDKVIQFEYQDLTKNIAINVFKISSTNDIGESTAKKNTFYIKNYLSKMFTPQEIQPLKVSKTICKNGYYLNTKKNSNFTQIFY